jgi:hypothetical protein
MTLESTDMKNHYDLCCTILTHVPSVWLAIPSDIACTYYVYVALLNVLFIRTAWGRKRGRAVVLTALPTPICLLHLFYSIHPSLLPFHPISHLLSSIPFIVPPSLLPSLYLFHPPSRPCEWAEVVRVLSWYNPPQRSLEFFEFECGTLNATVQGFLQMNRHPSTICVTLSISRVDLRQEVCYLRILHHRNRWSFHLSIQVCHLVV